MFFYPASHTKFINYDKNGMSDRKGQYSKKDEASERVSLQAGVNFNKTFGDHLLFANVTWNVSTSKAMSTTVIAEGFGNDYMDDISFGTNYEKNGNRGGVIVNCGRSVLSELSTIHMPIVIFLMPRFEEVLLLPMEKIVVGVHSGH